MTDIPVFGVLVPAGANDPIARVTDIDGSSIPSGLVIAELNNRLAGVNGLEILPDGAIVVSDELRIPGANLIVDGADILSVIGATVGGMVTPTAVRNLLQSLAGVNRLAASAIQGLPVDQGAGWTPTLAAVIDSNRRVLQLTGWTNPDGGQVLPGALQAVTGFYLGPTGFVATAAQGTDIRGGDGAAGPTGPIGPVGPAGPQGPTGSPNRVAVNTETANGVDIQTAPNAQLWFNATTLFAGTGLPTSDIYRVTLPSELFNPTPTTFPYLIRIVNLSGTVEDPQFLEVLASPGRNYILEGAPRVSTFLRRGQTMEIEFPGSGQPPIAALFATAFTPGTNLANDEFDLRQIVVDLSSGAIINGLGTEVAQAGYAYKVGTGGLFFSEQINAGDVIIALVDNPDITSTSNDWAIIRGTESAFLSIEQLRFLQQWAETDREEFIRSLSDFHVWFSDTRFTALPFLDPGADPSNPRPDQTDAYVGGAISFSQAFNRFNSVMTIRVPTSITSVVSSSLLHVVFQNSDGDQVRSIPLSSFALQTALVESDYEYYAFGPDELSQTLVNYVAGQSVILTESQLIISFAADPRVVQTALLPDQVSEANLDPEVRSKLNGTSGVTALDAAKLEAIGFDSEQDPIDDSVLHRLYYGPPPALASAYSPAVANNVGIFPSFETQQISLLVDANVTVTDVRQTNAPNNVIPVVEVTSVRVAGSKVYTATLPPSGNNPALENYRLSGTVERIDKFQLGLGWDVLEGALDSAVVAKLNDRGEAIPEALTDLARGARILERASTGEWRSINDHAGVGSMVQVFQERPTDGDSRPPTAVVNEIDPGSEVTIGQPGDLANVLFPEVQDFGSGNIITVDHLSVATDGALSGPGVIREEVEMIYPAESASNFRLLVGFWFGVVDVPSAAQTVLLSISNEDIPSIHSPMLVYNNQGRLLVPSTTASGSRQITSTEYLSNGSGFTTQREQGGTPGDPFAAVAFEVGFRVYDADTYTLAFRYLINDNDEGTQTRNIVIPNVGADVARVEELIAFNGGNNLTIGWRFASQINGVTGPQHAIEIDFTLTGAAQVLEVQVLHGVTRTVDFPTSTTFGAPGALPINLREGARHRAIIQFHTNDAGDRLLADMIIDAFDAQGQSRVFEVTDHDYGYGPQDLSWTSIRIGDDVAGGQFAGSQYQALKFNNDTPRTEELTVAALRNLLDSADNRDSRVFGQAIEPVAGNELVRFVEPVNFASQILVSPSGNRFVLLVDDAGSLVVSPV